MRGRWDLGQPFFISPKDSCGTADSGFVRLFLFLRVAMREAHTNAVPLYYRGVRGVVVVSLLLCAATLARADEATPDQRAKARQLGEAALRKLDDNGDYAGASDLFMKAYETSHELPYLINVAVTQRKAKLPQQAVATYRRVIAEGGVALTPGLRAQIEADIASVAAESGQALVRTEGAPAEILLDDRIVGAASKVAPLLVLIGPDAGRSHTLRARRAGFVEANHTIETLSLGAPQEIVLTLTAIPTLGTLTIESVPTGAMIDKHGKAPLTIELPPGDHAIWGSLPGHERTLQNVHIVAGESRKVTLVLREIAPSWWDKHKLQVAIGVGIAVVATGAFITRQALEPDYGKRYDYP